MTKDERYIATLQFQNKVLKSSGNSYEELFTCVMQQANPYFTQVKPQGSWGDKKNDGFDPTTGTYYQVYAQRHGFIPNLSILDLLFNMGNEAVFWL